MAWREAQHGTATRYNDHGCRCELCREWRSARALDYRQRNLDKVRERDRNYKAAHADEARARDREYYSRNRDGRIREYREANREYILAKLRSQVAGYRAQSAAVATVPRYSRWMPHEDALLAAVSSNLAAASALGRTYSSVSRRRQYLKQTSRG